MFHYRSLFTISLIATGLFLNGNNSLAATDHAPVYDAGQTEIHVSADNPVFTLKLKSNPSTGYSWSVANADNDVLVLVSHSYQAPDTKLIGASGFELWTFSVRREAFAKSISTKLEMKYSRPWEKDKIAESAIFTIISG